MAQDFKLPSDISELAEQAVATGRFRSVEDVLRAGVRAVTSAEPENDGLSAEERAAVEQVLIDRLHDGQALQRHDSDSFFEKVRQARAAHRANR